MISEKFKKMAQKIYINPDEKVVESIASEYQFIPNNLEILKTIDVDNDGDDNEDNGDGDDYDSYLY